MASSRQNGALPLCILGALVAIAVLRPNVLFIHARRTYQKLGYRTHPAEKVSFPCRRSAFRGNVDCTAKDTADEEYKISLQLPQANHFMELEAAGCIEEGCSVEKLSDLVEKLSFDEGRIRKTLEKLQVARAKFDVPSYEEEIGLLRLSLSRFHSLSNELQAMLGVQNSDFTKEFAAYLAFGKGHTAGFLNLKAPSNVKA
mmetsp:Transcript_3575/g.6292  ORF Transcript_3575/g.6292 Transcript_3575/m.6292 type:complete len:200 (+) Transcript_3575:61-660(+)